MSPDRRSQPNNDRTERERETQPATDTGAEANSTNGTAGHDENANTRVESSGDIDPGDAGEEHEQSRSEDERGDGNENGGRRDVVVPRELYKVVTVFSTLIAISAVVAGFITLDTATNRTLAAASEVNLPLAALGVFLIVLGAAVYAFAARFRTQGMGSPNSDADENSGNG